MLSCSQLESAVVNITARLSASEISRKQSSGEFFKTVVATSSPETRLEFLLPMETPCVNGSGLLGSY